MRPRSDRQGGFALLTVLVAILLLSVLVVQFHFGGRVQMRLVSRQAEQEQTRLAAGSGVGVARSLLEQDPGEVDSAADPWALPLEQELEDLHFSLAIEDQDGKLGLGDFFDLDRPEQERRASELSRLTARLNQPPGLGAALLDWIDEDDQARPGGAEESYYLQKGYRCKNRALDTAFEVYRVRGALATRAEEQVRWEDYLSPRTAAEVNVNTASGEVLQCLSEKLDRTLVEAIVARRAGRPFRRVSELKDVPGMSQEIYNEVFDRLTVSSSRFSISSTATLNGTSTTVVAEVERSGESTRLLYWSVR